MVITLTSLEARLIGCLIEKEITTPEQYPLSLNALTNACNQKSNREPVLELDEPIVQQTLDSLIGKHLVSNQTGYGARVTKYQHRFCNTAFGQLQFTERELAIVCELLLRGPQTPGELRSHCSRLCALADVTQVEAVLQQLATRTDGPFVMRLAREPGKREARYAHLFCGEVGGAEESPAPGLPLQSNAAGSPATQPESAQLEQRIAMLEAEVAALKVEVAALQHNGDTGSADSGLNTESG